MLSFLAASCTMTFKSVHHNTILTVLESLDSDVLREGFAYFGGGTLITPDFGEYRWSKDVDFICPVSSSGYRHLRTVVFEGGHLKNSGSAGASYL